MKKILIIDDSSTNINAAKRFLDGTNYELLMATSGEEGISVLLDKKIDFIFLDIDMPLLNGYDVSSLIKGNEDYKDIPLVMVSSRDTNFDMYKGLTYGADDYISKPYTKEKLLKTINKFLSEE